MEIPKSTLRTVRNKDDEVKESCKSARGMTASKATQIMAPIWRNWKGF
jgi:hypothetical protein